MPVRDSLFLQLKAMTRREVLRHCLHLHCISILSNVCNSTWAFWELDPAQAS